MRTCARESESEKDLEARLVKEIRLRGGLALKYTSQFHRGIPDRIVLLPHHTIGFVELKSTGKKPEPLQVVAMNRLRSLGFSVYVIDCSESLDWFLTKMDQRLVRCDEIASQVEEEMCVEEEI